MSLLLRTAQLHRAVGIARRPHRIPRQARPLAIEADYTQKIVAVVRRAREGWDLAVVPGILAHARRLRADAPGDDARDVAARARAANARSIRAQELELLAYEFARRTAAYQRDQFARQIRAALGVDYTFTDERVRAMLADFVHENVALIESIPERLATDVEQMILRAITSNQPYEALAAAINERFAVGERRAELIARDQINKLFEIVNRARQREIGIEKFAWRDMGDSRVRRLHVLHATRDVGFGPGIYRIDEPPEEEGVPVYPGDPIGCRCSQEPVFSDLKVAARRVGPFR